VEDLFWMAWGPLARLVDAPLAFVLAMVFPGIITPLWRLWRAEARDRMARALAESGRLSRRIKAVSLPYDADLHIKTKDWKRQQEVAIFNKVAGGLRGSLLDKAIPIAAGGLAVAMIFAMYSLIDQDVLGALPGTSLWETLCGDATTVHPCGRIPLVVMGLDLRTPAITSHAWLGWGLYILLLLITGGRWVRGMRLPLPGAPEDVGSARRLATLFFLCWLVFATALLWQPAALFMAYGLHVLIGNAMRWMTKAHAGAHREEWKRSFQLEMDAITLPDDFFVAPNGEVAPQAEDSPTAPARQEGDSSDTDKPTPLRSKLFAGVAWVGVNLCAWQMFAPETDAVPLWVIVAVAVLAQLALIPLAAIACFLLMLLPIGGLMVLVFSLKLFGLEGLAEKWRFDRSLARGDIMTRLSRKRIRRGDRRGREE
jgi:hypothetical protein